MHQFFLFLSKLAAAAETPRESDFQDDNEKSLTPKLSQVWTGEMSLLRHKIEISESEKENIPSSRRKRMIWTKMWRKTSQTEI